MKVILLQDVKSLGKKGAMVEVNEGYARNFIIPKKLGMEATPKNMNDFKLRKAHEETQRPDYREAFFLQMHLPCFINTPYASSTFTASSA
mgnify:CR=1 FL=1